MLSPRYKLHHLPLFLAKYAYLTVRRKPLAVHFEVTQRCNAHCGFCDYWKTPQAARNNESASFAEAARFFNPMFATFTGGEPTLRRDLESLVSAVRQNVHFCYITLLSHGGTMTLERARSLWAAGIDQFNFSLDFLDERHDAARGIPGLSTKIFRTVSAMRDAQLGAIRFNTVIRKDNLDQILPIVQRAESLGCGVNFSVYTDFKNGNRQHLVAGTQAADVERITADLLRYKRRRRGVISNSDYYLAQIPRYVRGEMSEPCRSGIRTLHIDPGGRVKRCPDFPTDFDWRDFKRYTPIACNECYYACRGEAEAPLEWSRVLDMIA
ncbi:MAG TPA: radical SAM protein [Gemmatimonadaceae bacterium]|nr:radical SAM protein [Gemmatimonadaceae bacterium]